MTFLSPREPEAKATTKNKYKPINNINKTGSMSSSHGCRQSSLSSVLNVKIGNVVDCL